MLYFYDFFIFNGFFFSSVGRRNIIKVFFSLELFRDSTFKKFSLFLVVLFFFFDFVFTLTRSYKSSPLDSLPFYPKKNFQLSHVISFSVVFGRERERWGSEFVCLTECYKQIRSLTQSVVSRWEWLAGVRPGKDKEKQLFQNIN